MKYDIQVKYLEFERDKPLWAGPIEVAWGRINGRLWIAESHFASPSARRAFRVPGVTLSEARMIAKAIRKFEDAKEKLGHP